MSEKTLHIIGLEKDIEDPGTGATAHFHAVRAYSVMLIGESSSSVTFASWVSRAAFDSGKNPLAHVTVQINAAPTGDSAQFPHWFAERVLQAQQAHDLSGATPVYAEPITGEAPAAEEPAA